MWFYVCRIIDFFILQQTRRRNLCSTYIRDSVFYSFLFFSFIEMIFKFYSPSDCVKTFNKLLFLLWLFFSLCVSIFFDMFVLLMMLDLNSCFSSLWWWFYILPSREDLQKMKWKRSLIYFVFTRNCLVFISFISYLPKIKPQKRFLSCFYKYVTVFVMGVLLYGE